MSNELNRALAELDKLEADLKARLAGVQAAKLALTGNTQALGAPEPKRAVKAKKRAPAGSLAKAIKEVLAASPGIGNGEIRAALKKSGYGWSMDEMYVSKCLMQLKGDSEVTSERIDGGRVVYHLAQPSVPTSP